MQNNTDTVVKEARQTFEAFKIDNPHLYNPTETVEDVKLPDLPASVLMRMRNHSHSNCPEDATREALYGREQQLLTTLRELKTAKEELSVRTSAGTSALYVPKAAYDAKVADLEKRLEAMTVDRDLWQGEHNGDCPNLAKVEELESQLVRLVGAKFSDRSYAALQDRAVQAENELATLKSLESPAQAWERGYRDGVDCGVACERELLVSFEIPPYAPAEHKGGSE